MVITILTFMSSLRRWTPMDIDFLSLPGFFPNQANVPLSKKPVPYKCQNRRLCRPRMPVMLDGQHRWEMGVLSQIIVPIAS